MKNTAVPNVEQDGSHILIKWNVCVCVAHQQLVLSQHQFCKTFAVSNALGQLDQAVLIRFQNGKAF